MAQHVWRIVAAVAFLPLLGISLNPIDWASGGWDRIRGVGGSVGRAVITAIETVITPILHAIMDVIGFGWTIFNTALDLVRTLANLALAAAQDAIDQVRNLARQLWGIVYPFVRSLVDTAVDAVLATVRWGWDVFNRLIAEAFQHIANAIEWVRREVFDTLAAWITGAIRWVNETVIPFLRGLLDAAVDGLIGALRGLLDKVRDLWAFVFGAVRDVVALVLRISRDVWDFLIDPFGWLVRWIGNFFERAPRAVLGWLLGIWEREGDAVEDRISKWLGR